MKELHELYNFLVPFEHNDNLKESDLKRLCEELDRRVEEEKSNYNILKAKVNSELDLRELNDSKIVEIIYFNKGENHPVSDKCKIKYNYCNYYICYACYNYFLNHIIKKIEEDLFIDDKKYYIDVLSNLDDEFLFAKNNLEINLGEKRVVARWRSVVPSFLYKNMISNMLLNEKSTFLNIVTMMPLIRAYIEQAIIFELLVDSDSNSNLFEKICEKEVRFSEIVSCYEEANILTKEEQTALNKIYGNLSDSIHNGKNFNNSDVWFIYDYCLKIVEKIKKMEKKDKKVENFIEKIKKSEKLKGVEIKEYETEILDIDV